MPEPTFATHDVFNQSPPFVNVNLFTSDRALCEAVRREGAGWAETELVAFGQLVGSERAFELGRLANENPPRLRRFDARGFPLDIVEFHPAYHEVMGISMGAGLHCLPWEHLAKNGERPPGVHVARCAGSYMAAQMEAGHCCPVTMTNASVATLQLQPEVARAWLPKVLVRAYDHRFAPAQDKASLTLGMGMTEKQGGTDVRANTTQARPVSGGGPGGEYLLTGHKWFLSAPMSDAFLMLAQAPGGLSCFLVPRFLPDGSVNALRLQRLKDKLGNRSNASAEVELPGAHGWLIGEEGRGVPVIIEMVTLTRLDCAVASAGLMRFALAHAIHHARHRTVFQRKLVDHPLMAQVLADLALDAEAATALVFRLASAFDGDGETEAAFKRLMTPVIKYWVCKTAPNFAYEAMECLGGNGYVEELPLARLYREVPVNAIWEGSGNVMGLDVLRVLQRAPETAGLILEQLAEGARGEPRLEAAVASLKDRLARPEGLEAEMRNIVERLALTTAGCLLRAEAPAAVSDAFIATRIAGGWRSTYGAGLGQADVRAILDRAAPCV